MNQDITAQPEAADFAVEELDTLAAPGWLDTAHDVTQITALGGAAFVIGLSIT
ncbi:hypothetical protein ACFV4F_20320 [Kitasatospora sp. NPDC059722]|uniref:hypothetical protein n=1 Tax=unclassified Kitasatospora TaxID=2633591 RepID=UPI003666E988